MLTACSLITDHAVRIKKEEPVMMTEEEGYYRRLLYIQPQWGYW